MKVTQEKLPKSQIGLEIEIPPEMSQKAYEQVLQDLARTANIPGFRKGKVPRHIILQRFGSTRLKAAALEELLRDGVKQAIKQEQIDAIGEFYLNSSQDELVQRFEPGQPLMISVKVDVSPEVKLKQYTGLQVKAEEVKYDPSSVDGFLEERRKEQATLIPVEGRSGQMGDVALVDFNGRLVSEGDASAEAQAIPGGEAQDFQVELAPGRFIEGFVDGIVGMNPGETKEISVQFPEDYPQKELAGKPAVFEVTLKELKEKELPELNDDFAQEVSEFQTLAELRETLEKRFQETATSKTDANKAEALLKELEKQVEVELPETLIQQEVDAMLTQTAVRLSNQGVDVRKLFTQEMVAQMRQASRNDAIERIKRTLALGEVAKQESISVEAAAVEAKVKELMQQYSDRDLDLEKMRDFVEEDLLKEKIVAWLEEHSTVELVPEGTLQASSEEEGEVEVEEASTATIDVSASSTEVTSEPTQSE